MTVKNSAERFNLVYQNIRSMRRNADKLFAYIGTLKEKPLLIGLSEIWIYDDEVDNYNLDGYSLFVSGNNASRSGGVAIYIRNSLYCNNFIINFSTFDALGITFSLNSKDICVVCVYRLHYMSIEKFIEEFSKMLGSLSYINLLILGDFNIDLLQNSSVVDRFLVLLANNGLEAVVKDPTRITDVSATCIDNILCRLDQRFFDYTSCSVTDLRITDHCLIEMELSGKFTRNSSPSKKLDMFHINYGKLNEVLLHEDWNDVYRSADASAAFDNFYRIFGDHLAICTNRSRTKKSEKLKPWMSDCLLNLLCKRNKFCRLAAKHPNNIRLKAYSLKLCNMVNIKITSTKRDYYSQKFLCNGKDARKNWQTVNEIIVGPAISSEITQITDGKGTMLTDSLLIANEFNKYFTNVGDSKCATGDINPADKANSVSDDHCPINSFYFEPITPCELYIIVHSLKNGSSPGRDSISNCTLKRVCCFLVDVLCFIYNFSMDTGIFPSSLKSAVVVPIFKKSDKGCLNNYRPISLLSVFSKIFEKAIKSRVVSFLNSNNILSPLQHGFREKRNTEGALVSFLEDLSVNIDRGRKTSALFMDMTKAFDRVVHTTLLKKLYSFGFRGTAYHWFLSYLKGRTQVVRVNSVLSEELSVNVGVPQGSVLGPLLFIIYINCIFRQPFCGSLIAFADDLSFTYSGLSTLENVNNIRHDLSLLSVWLTSHNLMLSDKTKIMHFRDKQTLLLDLIYHEYGCRGGLLCVSNYCVSIKQVKEFKYLGIIIDEDLNWKAQIKKLNSKLLLVARKMYVLRLFCPKFLLRMVYFALVDSTLQYGLSCWGSANKSTMSPLYVRQKLIIRTMCFKNVLHPSWPLFKMLELLPLRHMFVFKVLRIFYTISGNNFLTYDGINLRSNFLFKMNVPRFRLQLRMMAFYVICPIIFNNLPLAIRSCRSLSVFSKTLKAWLMQNNHIEQLFEVLF